MKYSALGLILVVFLIPVHGQAELNYRIYHVQDFNYQGKFQPGYEQSHISYMSVVSPLSTSHDISLYYDYNTTMVKETDSTLAMISQVGNQSEEIEYNKTQFGNVFVYMDPIKVEQDFLHENLTFISHISRSAYQVLINHTYTQYDPELGNVTCLVSQYYSYVQYYDYYELQSYEFLNRTEGVFGYYQIYLAIKQATFYFLSSTSYTRINWGRVYLIGGVFVAMVSVLIIRRYLKTGKLD